MAGLGTSGTMVAGSACLFFVVSTLIAFNSWSGSDLSTKIQSLFVGGNSPSISFDVPGPQRVAANASTAAAAVTPGSGRRDAETGPRGGNLGGSTIPEQPAPAVGGDGSFSVAEVPPVVALPPAQGAVEPPDLPEIMLVEAGPPDLGRLVADTTHTLAGTVGQTTDQLGASLTGVNLALGGGVSSMDQTLSAVVASPGHTVGGVVDGTGHTFGGLLPAGD